MKSSIKKTMKASLVVIAGLATLGLQQVQAAPKNGDGLVYHRSDCSPGHVRVYGGGGDFRGSTCGQWLAPEMIKVIWRGNGNHNWRYDEIWDCIDPRFNFDNCREK